MNNRRRTRIKAACLTKPATLRELFRPAVMMMARAGRSYIDALEAALQTVQNAFRKINEN
nr:hypothetical protein [uncultured Anaeromusa sp.]